MIVLSAKARPLLIHDTFNIRVYRGKRRRLKLVKTATGFNLYLPSSVSVDHPAVRDFLDKGLASLGAPPQVQRTTREDILAYLDQWSARLGVSPTRVRFRALSRSWGSCTSRRTITFNSGLIYTPPHLAEYVVLHELAHLLEMNHGDRFKALLTRHMPDWETRERDLMRHFENTID